MLPRRRVQFSWDKRKRSGFLNKEVLRRFKWAIENPLLTSPKLQKITTGKD